MELSRLNKEAQTIDVTKRNISVLGSCKWTMDELVVSRLVVSNRNSHLIEKTKINMKDLFIFRKECLC